MVKNYFTSFIACIRNQKRSHETQYYAQFHFPDKAAYHTAELFSVGEL